ncbi:hypothetical protein DFP78_11354 [Photobacterium lutimaris]|nr:hypothetical protein DFP78_11354 [Photobacterium lutimaris]
MVANVRFGLVAGFWGGLRSKDDLTMMVALTLIAIQAFLCEFRGRCTDL